MPTSLITFDLDGTLVDSRLDLAASANAMLREFAADPLSLDEISAMVGDGARMLVTRVLRAARAEHVDVSTALDRFLELYDRHLVDSTALYPGVLDALLALEGQATLTLLTNKPGHHTERLLVALGVRQCFSLVIGGDSSHPRKPDPAGLRHIMAASAATPANTVMVGDSIVDVQTARNAGTHACIARYGFGRLPGDTPIASTDINVHDPLDLARALLAFVAARG